MAYTTSTTTTTGTTAKPEYTGDALESGHSLDDLNYLYNQAESADQDVFAEMRSGILLVAGEHYQKKDSHFFRRIRDAKELSDQQKLRLTKNHIRKICQTYSNNIMSMSPGVGFEPKNEKELHDQKVADLHHAVWRDATEKYQIDDLMDDWCDSFVQMGEVAVKIYFDPMKGTLKGYEGATEPDGTPSLDEMGQQVPDKENPVYTGEFCFDEIYGFNLLRPVECKDLRKAEWLGCRSMVSTKDLKKRFKDKAEKIQDSTDETYMVFDASRGGYYKSTGEVCVREYYFRPGILYPKGYFYITTEDVVLAEGELPGGVFPIVVQVFDKIQTTPRGRSAVKQMRPYQAEINRSASKMAEHQITLGDDKLLIQNGTKVSAAATLPGVRAYSYTGAVPTILEGRSGAQYLEYMNSQITELYSVMNIAEDTQENQANLDPYVLLFRSARQKKKFQRYIKRYEKFLINVVKTFLSLAKVHLDDDALIYAMGSMERVNIPEFKKLPDICYEIKVVAQSEDIESKLGKQIVLNHALQYVGQRLQPEDIGKLMRQMPFADFDASFDDMTIDYDSTTNDILALDRGEQPPVGEYDNHVYCIKRLTSRMRKPDFKFLPPNVQQNYHSKVDLHQQMQAFQVSQVQRAEQGFIPTGGYLVAIDFYVSDPTDSTGVKTRRARIPYEAIQWLIKQLEAQGQTQDSMEGMELGAQAQIAEKLTGAGRGPSVAPAGAPTPGSRMTPPNGMGARAPMREMPTGMGGGVGNVGQNPSFQQFRV